MPLAPFFQPPVFSPTTTRFSRRSSSKCASQARHSFSTPDRNGLCVLLLSFFPPPALPLARTGRIACNTIPMAFPRRTRCHGLPGCPPPCFRYSFSYSTLVFENSYLPLVIITSSAHSTKCIGPILRPPLVQFSPSFFDVTFSSDKPTPFHPWLGSSFFRWPSSAPPRLTLVGPSPFNPTGETGQNPFGSQST